MGFGQAISVCFRKYVTFSGRAMRSEYWYFVLFYMIGSIIFAFADGFMAADSGSFFSPLSIVFGLATLLPSIAVLVRRLHDIGRSGWWVWIGLIPLIGPIVLLVFACLRSEPVDNPFGPAPNA